MAYSDWGASTAVVVVVVAGPLLRRHFNPATTADDARECDSLRLRGQTNNAVDVCGGVDCAPAPGPKYNAMSSLFKQIYYSFSTMKYAYHESLKSIQAQININRRPTIFSPNKPK